MNSASAARPPGNRAGYGVFRPRLPRDTQAWLQTEAGKSSFKQRQHYVETQFALAKDLHALRRGPVAKALEVQIQACLTAAVMNLKKLTKYGSLETPKK